VAEALKQMGYEVTTLTGADLTTNRLKDFDAVVIGIRAFNVRTDLVAHLPDLFAFVESGGNVIEQYNRPGNDLKTDKLAPYSLRISAERVTDENATMKFLRARSSRAQCAEQNHERGFRRLGSGTRNLFSNQWDEHFTTHPCVRRRR